MKTANTESSPLELSLPLELSPSNIDRIDENALGVILVSKFPNLSTTGALAIEAGRIRDLLIGLSRSFEASYFFRYRVTETEGDALLIRDAIRSAIEIHALGE